MCPTFNFNFLTNPSGSSRIKKYLGFQKNNLFGKKFSLIFTIFLSLSKTIISKGVFRKNECIPNLVFKDRIEFLNLIIPKDLSLMLFKWITFESALISRFRFLSTKTLYMNCLEYQKGV